MILFDPERDSGVVALWNSNSRKPVGIQFVVMDMVYGLAPVDWLGLEGAS
jgi:beta-lactamase class C